MKNHSQPAIYIGYLFAGKLKAIGNEVSFAADRLERSICCRSNTFVALIILGEFGSAVLSTPIHPFPVLTLIASKIHQRGE